MVDQQLADEVQSLLAYLLSNSYIIRQEILPQVPSKIVDSFIDAYCTDQGHHGKAIPMYFAFPNTPPRTAFLLVQFKGSEEDSDSSVLGSNEGYLQDSSQGNQIHEKLLVHTAIEDGQNVAYVEPNQPVYQVDSIPQATNFKLVNNRIYLMYTEQLDQEKVYVDVFYSVLLSKQGKEYPIGINTKEGVTIDFISTNTNTIRCLSAIMTYIRVYLKQSLEENGNVYLPEIEMNGMDIIADQQQNAVPDQQLYYRRLQVTYHVTQTISEGAGKLLQNIKIKEGLSDDEEATD